MTDAAPAPPQAPQPNRPSGPDRYFNLLIAFIVGATILLCLGSIVVLAEQFIVVNAIKLPPTAQVLPTEGPPPATPGAVAYPTLPPAWTETPTPTVTATRPSATPTQTPSATVTITLTSTSTATASPSATATAPPG